MSYADRPNAFGCYDPQCLDSTWDHECPVVPADEPAERGFTCPRCGRTSYHPTDLAEGYCGACHDWTGRGRSGVRSHLTPPTRAGKT